jgi:glycosyltransferase involved in cell wall biosynthesis
MRGILVSHPTGNANVRAVLAGLFEAGILEEFHTTIAAFPGNGWEKLGRTRWGRDLQRRTYEARFQPLTRQHPARELGRMASNKLGLRRWSQHESGTFCIDAVYHDLDRAVARALRERPRTFGGIYAYEDGALASFQAARECGLRRIYDLPIAYWQTLRQLLTEEAERLPAWKATLAGGVADSEQKLERKTRELELAEVVMCASEFVARSLPAEARVKKKIVVAPFGSPLSGPARDEAARGPKLRVLFAGSMSQRKGLGDLFAAIHMLHRPDVELIVMGAPQTDMEFYHKELTDFTYEGSRPHNEVLALMRSCDVFCLPSIVEGRALVMQEAMSQGLPLIITPNTGGEDLIDEGVTGFLVPIRCPEHVAEKIAWFADHRSALPEMSRAARAKAESLTWQAYGRTVANAILDLEKS